MKIIILNGEKYKILYNSKTKAYGYINYPSDKDKVGRIGIRKGISEYDILDTEIHEMLHAIMRFADETFVHNAANDLSKALWELGYRKNEESKESGK